MMFGLRAASDWVAEQKNARTAIANLGAQAFFMVTFDDGANSVSILMRCGHEVLQEIRPIVATLRDESAAPQVATSTAL